jgi:hypothetical protein
MSKALRVSQRKRLPKYMDTKDRGHMINTINNIRRKWSQSRSRKKKKNSMILCNRGKLI